VERRLSPRPQRVLVVDDSSDTRELWRLWLSFWGFSVAEAQNGYEAFEQATASSPALILMDLWMPGVDGIAAMKLLKGDIRTAHVPVLALSAQCHSPDASAVLAAGAEAFITKPCDPDLLIEHIRAAMSRRRPV
jgi:CheY-like chemotaxis protein